MIVTSDIDISFKLWAKNIKCPKNCQAYTGVHTATEFRIKIKIKTYENGRSFRKDQYPDTNCKYANDECAVRVSRLLTRMLFLELYALVSLSRIHHHYCMFTLWCHMRLMQHKENKNKVARSVFSVNQWHIHFNLKIIESV